MQCLWHWRHPHAGWRYSDIGTETEWIMARQWQQQRGDQCPGKNVAASSPRAPNVSTASGTKQYWSHNAVYFARLRSTATVQAAIDTRCKVAYGQNVWTCEVPHQAPAVWPWHQCQAIWTIAIIPWQTRRLQSGGNLRSSERALYEIIGALCHEWWSADCQHDRPWTPYWSTFFSADTIMGSANWRTKT